MPATPHPAWTQPTDEKTARTRSAVPAGRPADPLPPVSAIPRTQLQDKARSLQRGLAHVQSCRAGDACGRALCHSTKRLLRTFATHECARRAAPAADCRVCRLWQFLLADKSPTAGKSAERRLAAAEAPPPPVVRPVCGLAELARRLATRSASAAVRRRAPVAAKEAAASRRL